MNEEVIIEEPEIINEPEIVDEPEIIDEPQEEKVPKGVQKRIDEITRQKYEAQRDLERERAERAALKLQLEQLQSNKPIEQPKTLANGMPDPEQFAAGRYDPDYIEAVAEWKVEQKFQAQRQQAAAQQMQRYIIAKEQEARDNHADYDAVVSEVLSHPVTSQQWFREILLDTENPSEISYFLGKNQEELNKIYKMSPTQAMRYIGRIEAKLESPTAEPAKPVTAAPNPITPLGSARSSTVSNKDPEKMTMEEYAKWRASKK